MIQLWMYDTIAHVQEKNDAICKYTMQLRMYKKRMLKNKLQKGAINLKHVPTQEKVVDVLTKPMDRVKFEYF